MLVICDPSPHCVVLEDAPMELSQLPLSRDITESVTNTDPSVSEAMLTESETKL